MTTPTPDFEKLREEIARAVAAEILKQDYMGPDAFRLPDDLTLPYLDQGEVDFGKVADAILAIPAIADVLRMKPIQTMPGSSESA